MPFTDARLATLCSKANCLKYGKKDPLKLIHFSNERNQLLANYIDQDFARLARYAMENDNLYNHNFNGTHIAQGFT